MAHFAKYKWNDYVGLVKYDRTSHENDEIENAVQRDLKHKERQSENFCFTGGFTELGYHDVELSDFGIEWTDTGKILEEVEHNKSKALDKVKVLKRQNVKHVVSVVFTVPPEVPQAEQRKCMELFFKYMLQHEAFGGYKNFLLASGHFDETTPHCTYDFCPVTSDGRLSAKDVVTRSTLQMFHVGLNKYLDEQLGYHVSVENGKTKNGNKSINQLKDKTNKEEIKMWKSKSRYFMKEARKGIALENALARMGLLAKVKNEILKSDYPSEAILEARYENVHNARSEAGKKGAQERRKDGRSM